MAWTHTCTHAHARIKQVCTHVYRCAHTLGCVSSLWMWRVFVTLVPAGGTWGPQEGVAPPLTDPIRAFSKCKVCPEARFSRS